MKAVKCPVCDGKGQIVNCFGEGGSYQEVDCHGCQGKGWVEVSGNGQTMEEKQSICRSCPRNKEGKCPLECFRAMYQVNRTS